MPEKPLAKLTKAELVERLDQASTQVAVLSESFDRVMASLQREDRGWKAVYTPRDAQKGLTLEELREWDAEITPFVAANPLGGAAQRLRAALVWQDGIKYRGLPKKGRVKALTELPINVERFFGPDARLRREGRLFSAGLAAYLGDNATKTLAALPISEITGEVRDPDLDYEVWAYRRQWQVTDPATGKAVDRAEWYLTDLHRDRYTPGMTVAVGAGKREPVNGDKTIFVQHANRQDGYTYGHPDGIATWIWGGVVRDADMDGIVMTQALASIAFTAVAKSPDAASNAAFQVSQPNGPGSTVFTGQANGILPVSSAGKAYDFGGIDRLVGRVAVASDLPVEALLGESVEKISLFTRLLVEMRRKSHIAFDRRVLTWMGAKPDDLEVYFEPMDDPDQRYRDNQAIVLQHNTGLYEGEEIKRKFEALEGKRDPLPVPEGYMLPNNEKSMARTDIDPNGAAFGGDSAGSGSSVAAPDQGQSNGTGGKGNSGNDIRRD